MKRFAGIFTAVCTALFIAVQTAFSAAGWEQLAGECFAYFSQSEDNAAVWRELTENSADWAAFCRARLYGPDGAEVYAAAAEKRVEELKSSGRFVRPTDYQRLGIGISAAGGDASRAVELGVFLNDQLDKQGFNAYIWALIALNFTGIEPPENSLNTADTLTQHLISCQHEDGSFSLFGDGGDVDITAAAVYALSGTDAEGAWESAQRGADWLCAHETFSTMGVRNCESTAQAVIALTAAGRDEDALRAASQLEEYRREGGYAHLPEGDVNQTATTQAMEAFTALALSEQGRSLFSIRTEETSVQPESSEKVPATETTEVPNDVPGAETINQSVSEISMPEPAGVLSGTHIQLVCSIVSGAGVVACLVGFFARKKRVLLPAAVLLAALSGGVWLLDIRTPEEYYAQSGGGPLHVTFSADCSAALPYLEDSTVSVPEDGVVISRCELSLPEGASAFDALTAAARFRRVRVDYTGSVYGTYVRSIGYISEFDFGELSGWMYRVNGEFPQMSVSDYILSEGDVVEFVYTCDLGRDVGDHFTSESS